MRTAEDLQALREDVESLDASGMADRKSMPGEVLHDLIGELGLREKEGCNCSEVRSLMNTLGVDGCRQNRKKLLSMMRENAKGFGIIEKFNVAKNAVHLGIAVELVSLDPVAALFDYAVKQAEVSLSERSA